MAKRSGASLAYKLLFSKALQPGESLASVTLTAENVTATKVSETGGDIVIMVTAAEDAAIGTNASVTFTITTTATPVPTYVQTLMIPIERALVVQAA